MFGFALGRSRRLGFTLIELLAAISIISLLIAVMIPVLSSARETSRRLQCSVNLRTQVSALVAYSVDNRGWLPTYDPDWAKRVGDTFYAPAGTPIWQWGLNFTRRHQVIRLWGSGPYFNSDRATNVCPSRFQYIPLARTMWDRSSPMASDLVSMLQGKGDFKNYSLSYWPLSYAGNALGPLDVPRGQPRRTVFNIGDLPNTPAEDYLVRDCGNYYSWSDLPFNHARAGTSSTYSGTVDYVEGWNAGYPDGHVRWWTNE